MDNTLVLNILRQISKNVISPEHGLPMLKQALRTEAPADLIPDFKREKRTGIREVIFGPGKSVQQIIDAARELGRDNQPVMGTKIPLEYEPELKEAFPEHGFYHPVSRIFALNFDPGLTQPSPGLGDVLIITAGSADISIALECLATCRYIQIRAGLLCDVGVAGLHRVLENKDKIEAAKVLIVIAGMDGALPSVLAGLSSQPVIGVPTSIGYGAALNGFTSLFNMLNSCAPGVAAVNIDNGFGAACVAKKILTPHLDT
ncbi:MAG: nickel pincer cofactor biosynthesis protein LarB [Thermodesulfobacteriota bacterium]